MRSRKSIIIVIVLLISVLSFNSYPSFAKDSYRELVQETNYVEQEPIIILNDDDFTEHGFPGLGTKLAPYIIEGFNITTDEKDGIKIWDTTKYFIVQNCYVDTGYYCISISKVASGTALIQDNICINSNDGIFIGNSNNTRVINNYCANNYRYSIWFHKSSYGVVDSNTCVNNSALHFAYNCIDSTASNNELFNEGLRIYENNIENYNTYNILTNFVNNKVLGYFVNLEDAVFDTPIYGQLYLVSCKNIEIFNQNLDDTDGGIILQNCEDSYIHHVSCINSGIGIGGCNNVTISNTLCSDNGWGINCVESREIEITKNICTNNYAAGIHIRYSNRVLVEENICSQNGDGIEVSWSNYVNITKNECEDNRWEGIDIGPSDFAFVYQNYCSNNSNGIYIIGDNAIIKNNICLRSRTLEDYLYYYMNLQGFGIVARGMHSSLQITNNTGNENKYGIGVSWISNGSISRNYCSRNEVGLLLAASANNDVFNNSFCENSKNGIMVIGFPGDMWWGKMNAKTNNIVFNNICNNTLYGITLDALTNQNLVQFNNFIYNGLLLNAQAEDNGTRNIWESNFWSDLEGNSYNIDGLANSEDSSPLDEPLVITNEEIDIPPIVRSTFHSSMVLLVFLCLIVVCLGKTKRIKRI